MNQRSELCIYHEIITHKNDGMENVKNKRCQVLGCEKVPSFGLPGGGPGPPSWPNDMGPFGILFIDHIEIPAKNPFGFTHALTMMDGFTRFLIAEPVTSTEAWVTEAGNRQRKKIPRVYRSS